MPEIPDYFFKYHKRGGHTITFILIAQEAGATSYYQYMSTDGWWYIMRAVRAGAITTYTYTVPVDTASSAYDTGWTNRAAPATTYTTPEGAFGE